jgi:hypothetical protein
MSGDLRAARKTLETYIIRAGDVPLGPTWQEAMGALDGLIPEGAVMVTEETLAAALIQTGMYVDAGDPLVGLDSPRVYAAAILRHLREGT